MSNIVAAIFENDQERDRKTCVALATRAIGANRELAQWLLDHAAYSASEVSGWLGAGYSKSNILRLRKWAKSGFVDAPHARPEQDSDRERARRRAVRAPLKSLNNSEVPSEEEAEESYQDTLFEQACLLLSEMSDETRQRFFAKLKKEYGYAT